MPTFLVFNNGKQVDKVLGADPKKLSTAVKKIAAEADGNGGDGGYNWIGTALPKGYSDITDQVDVRNLDLLNADTTLGDARGLLANTKPSSLGGKVKEGEKKDWVESDTDEQLMLFMPFQSSLKLHTIHVTSLPPSGEEDAPMRPKSISIYSNRAHVLGFDEAEGIPATQSITLTERDWDAETGTAKIELRFVKFQNVTSLVIFVIDGEGDGEKVRIDRLRLIGETGEKREMGKLEKVGEGND